MGNIAFTIPASSVDSALTNFPVAIALSSSCGTTNFDATDVFDEVGADYDKLVITDSLSNSLYAEVELWDDTAEVAVLHVLVPSVSASADTVITISYDSANSSNANIGATGSTSAQQVWDSNFIAVYHMAQDPSIGGACLLDSTSNCNNGTPSGSMTIDDLVDGPIGKAWDFDGSDDWIDIPGVAPAIATSQQVTVDAVAQRTANTQCIAWSANTSTGGNVVVGLWYYNGNFNMVSPSGGYSTVPPLDTWVVQNFRFDSTMPDWELRFDGVTTDTGVTDVTISSTDQWSIGQEYDNSTVSDEFPGPIAEFRISDNIRSDAWVSVTYLSLIDQLGAFNSGLAGLSVRAVLDQEYYLIAALMRVLNDQLYGMLSPHRAVLDQIYGIRMLAALHQLYGDTPAFRRRLDQRYSNTPALRRLLSQDYGEAYKYRATLDQDYNFPEALRALLQQRYSIADHQVRAFINQQYEMLDHDLLRSLLDQIYVMAAGEALVQSTDLSVTCDGVAHTSAYNINLEQDEALYYMTGELQLADESEYLAYTPFGSAVVITVDGTSYNFIADRKRAPRTVGENSYIVPLVSQTALLDAPHATTEAGELTGMASALIVALAAPYSVDYQMVDWFIPPGRLQTNSEPPISIIKRIVAAAGGLVLTDPDGVLICRPEYPVSVNQWDSATPDIELTDQDDFFEVDPQPDPRDGFNMFFISDQEMSLDGLGNPEVIPISSRQVEIHVTNVPWDDSLVIALRHSGGNWVQLVSQGIIEETIEEEQVEIVAGSGKTARPFYGLTTEPDYRETDLGELTISESGEVASAITGNSLVYLAYTTKYYSWLATDDQIEDVQFYPEIIE